MFLNRVGERGQYLEKLENENSKMIATSKQYSVIMTMNTSVLFELFLCYVFGLGHNNHSFKKLFWKMAHDRSM